MPLQVASSRGHLDVVKLLLESGANVNARVKDWGTALCSASHNGHLDVVKVLLESGADLNEEGELAEGPPLHVASLHGYLDIVKLLLESGADVNAQGGVYGTALQAASHSGHLEITKQLLESGADVNAQGGGYGTALNLAASRGRSDIAKLLLKNGAIVDSERWQWHMTLKAESLCGYLKFKAAKLLLLLQSSDALNVQGGEHGTELQADRHQDGWRDSRLDATEIAQLLCPRCSGDRGREN